MEASPIEELIEESKMSRQDSEINSLHNHSQKSQVLSKLRGGPGESFKIPIDAKQYYRTSNASFKMLKKDVPDVKELRGECYIGFEKLLNNELRAFDQKESFIHELTLNKRKTDVSKSHK